MNEWPHDHDKLLEFLDKVRVEDYFVCDPVSHDKRVREWLLFWNLSLHL
jgi:hypothetical protein